MTGTSSTDSGQVLKEKRDDFSKPTVRALSLRAGHCCSLPECQRPTAGPSESGPDMHVNIGVAAHICAASPGGPRYDPTMTPEQRSSITNGIWLCQTHSRLIDVDTVAFTKSRLHEIKQAHERAQAARLAGESAPLHDSDFIALGPDLVFTGELIGIEKNIWSFRLDHFVIGDLNDLIFFGENFESLDPYDRYVLVNALGDGRQLADSPRWSKQQKQLLISVAVIESFPRINAENLPLDLALSDDNDLFIVNGDIATVRGLPALPQRIKVCLSTSRGEVFFHPSQGTRIREYSKEFFGSPWLPRLIKLETIRMACIPQVDLGQTKPVTPLMAVRKVESVEMVSPHRSDGTILFRFQMNIEGIGAWSDEIPIYISRDL
ncbi:hypothetical protein LOY42_12910 [Pseudomonas sp. B21-023]|uniref:hypothetical protein n=1 Tax=Pseudomonas sp. B21-023 TaxID=2895477 RepID=UPI00215E95A2|nr:hypothetical protein [Pseudomonas sp. B21-023]UVM19157.1 hypothetical protein LOY42_12910 [Pseudomonas sp. B21-023]